MAAFQHGISGFLNAEKPLYKAKPSAGLEPATLPYHQRVGADNHHQCISKLTLVLAFGFCFFSG